MTDHLRVAPFAGYRFNPAEIKDFSQVIAPPYDMISREEQERLHERHPHNVVRLILARDEADDGYRDRYERAAAAYRSWKESGVLIRDREPAVYAYRQDYEWGGKSCQRLGFIARVALTEFGDGAFPHESTLSGPKADRLRLLAACRANFSSIFSLFSDSNGHIQDRLEAETAVPPDSEIRDDQGVWHRLWRLSRPELHSWINDQMRDKTFIIADGHHRYETALEYRRRMREENAGHRGAWDYVMMFLAPIESPGLTVLPFHRVTREMESESALEKLAKVFKINERTLTAPSPEACGRILNQLDETSANRPAFVYYPGGESYYLIEIREDVEIAPYLAPGTSPDVGALDVTILHRVVFQGLLGLDEQKLVQEGGISFYSRPEEAFLEARETAGTSAFFLRPTRIDQVWKIALSGQKMPQKSTNFYPKLTTGLVINEL